MKILHAYTNTPLGAAGVYTSSWQRVSRRPLVTDAVIPIAHEKGRLVGFVTADQNSAAAGLVVQFSDDGVNVRASAPAMFIAAGVPTLFDIQVYGEFVRKVYTNGAVAQAAFTLESYLQGDL